MEVSINTNAMKVNYEQKPCYDIVFSKDFNLLNDEIQQLNISNKRICIVTESNVGPLYANEVKDIFMSNSKEVRSDHIFTGEKLLFQNSADHGASHISTANKT